MSWANTIIDGISDLGSDIFGNSADASAAPGDASSWFSDSSSSFGNIAKGLGTAFKATQDQKQSQLGHDESMYRFLERNMAMQPTNMKDEFQSHNRGPLSGGQNFSASAADIQNYWNGVLQSFVKTSQTGGTN